LECHFLSIPDMTLKSPLSFARMKYANRTGKHTLVLKK
jgi:hypothetical protein